MFKLFFGSFLVPISGPPSGRSFLPILADQGADLASSGRFWDHFGDPGFSKMVPWATPSRPETSKKGGPPSYSFHPVAVLEANSAPKGHQRPSVSIWDRFWSHLGLILDPSRTYFKQILSHIGAIFWFVLVYWIQSFEISSNPSESLRESNLLIFSILSIYYSLAWRSARSDWINWKVTFEFMMGDSSSYKEEPFTSF